MNPFVTRDRIHYRRWINLLPSLLVPGASQFLSGRRRTGMCWLTLFFVLKVCEYCVYLHPVWVMKKLVFIAAAAGIVALWLVMMADAFRTAIPRLGYKGWVPLVVVTSLISTSYWFMDQYVVAEYHVPTGSMSPTLMGTGKAADGRVLPCDQVFVNKLVYRFGDPRRGDIIVFNASGLKHPQIKKGGLLLKRVVGLPGETVSLAPPHVLIDGQKLLDPPIFEKISSGESGYHGFQFASGVMIIPAVLSKPSDKVVLKGDEYFVLGDNSVNSLDGRHHGPIQRHQIIGRVTKVYQPFDRVKVVE